MRQCGATLQPLAIARRQRLNHNRIAGRAAFRDVGDLLREDEIKKRVLRIGECIEIVRGTDVERFEAGKPRARR